MPDAKVVLLVIAGLALMHFLTMLWRRVHAGVPLERRDPLPLMAAAMAGALTAAGGVVGGGIPGNIIFQSSPVPGADTLRAFDSLVFPLVMLGGMFATGLAIALLTTYARRSGYFGTALTVFSYIAAFAAWLFIPSWVVVIWVIVVSVVMARRPAAEARA